MIASTEAPVTARNATRICAGTGVPRSALGMKDSTQPSPLSPAKPTGQMVELTGTEAPKEHALQTCRPTAVTLALVAPASTVVVSTCSTPANGPAGVVTVQPVLASLSVSISTLNSVVAA